MLTYLLLLVAAVLLGIGYLADQPVLVWFALGLSVLAAASVVALRFLDHRTARRTATRTPIDEPAVVHEPVEPVRHPHEETVGHTSDPLASPTEEVVFVPGRLTFHAPTCSSVTGKGTSSAARPQLEAGGMTACRRCLQPSAAS